MADPAIVSIAILKVNWETSRKDYIDLFTPFVAQCVLSLNAPVVTVSDLQTRMQVDFDLRVPQNSLQVMLGRLTAKGFLTKEHGSYVPRKEELKKLDFEATRRKVLASSTALINKLVAFARGKYRVSWTNVEGEQALLSFIGEHGLDVLGSALDGTTISPGPEPSSRAGFIVHAFVLDAYNSDQAAFSGMTALVKGNMLANVLRFPDISRVGKRFEATEVYCDTPFLLRLLGWEGPHRQGPCKELVDLLYEKGATLCCFHHTLDEVRDILHACLMALRYPSNSRGRGWVFRHIVDAGYTESDLDLELARLENSVKQRGIKVQEKPEYVPRFQIDEKALEEALENEVQYGEGRERRRRHDVDCLSAIYRLRKGGTYDHIEECKALFLTTNPAVCRAAKYFFWEASPSDRPGVHLAATDHSLTTVLWLKSPGRAPDLPTKHVLADCYSAMEPGEHLWGKYLHEIERLKNLGNISTDDYYLLRAYRLARQELMDLTMGDEHALVEGTVPQILERVKERIKAEEAAKVVEERKAREALLTQLEETKATQQAKDRRQLQKIEGLSRQASRWVTRLAYFLVLALLLFGAYRTFPQPLPDLISGWLSYVSVFGQLALAFAGFVNLFFGTPVNAFLRRAEISLGRWLDAKLKAWLLP